MKPPDRLRFSSVSVALAALLVSASVHFCCFAAWPGNPDWDVHHSVFAAQNFVVRGQLKSINLFPPQDDNLARHAQLHWMTNWPPAHSLLYAAIMSSGLSAGAATKLLALLCVLLGGLGWIYLARAFGASRYYTLAVALAYPWLSFIARLYTDYKNDHLACALIPWIYLAILRIESLRKCKDELWGRLLFAALLAGVAITVKYSLMPVLVASVLYLLWLDGRMVTRKRILRLVIFSGVLLLPGVILWLLNQAWGEQSYPLQPGKGLGFSLPTYAKNLISNTIGTTTGWDLIFIQLDILLGKLFGIQLFRGTIFFASSLLLIIWVMQFRRCRWDEKGKAFGIYLCLLTGALWVILAFMTVASGIGYDFSRENRLYVPIGMGWLMLCGVCADRMITKSVIRSAALCSLIIPIVFSAAYFAASGLFRKPYLSMPNSKTAWIPEGTTVSHAAFLSNLVAERGRKPDLLVATEGRFLTELGVPCFYTFRATKDDHHVYYSTVDLEVWAMVHPPDEDIMLSKFSKASKSERVSVPSGFPFVFYIFNFVADVSRHPQTHAKERSRQDYSGGLQLSRRAPRGITAASISGVLWGALRQHTQRR
jgi:hypothetical protein